MDNSWDNYDPAPCEFFHGTLMDLFHEFRRQKVGQENTVVSISGIELSTLIAKAKNLTYDKYPGEDKARPKNQKGELEELRRWKAEALTVMADFQAIGKEMGVKLGESVHDKILPYIKNLKAQ